MLFNSLPFLFFFVLFFALWPSLKRTPTARWSGLVGFSFLFYGWWDWRFLFLLIFSGLIDYGAALAMDQQPKHRRFWLLLSLLGNLGSLGIFKYSGFVAQILDDGAALLGWNTELYAQMPEFTLILPVGISFYTFQSMSYTIDVYRRQLKPTRHILHFFAYLSLFPQLVAGPIVRAKHLLHQLAVHQRVSSVRAWYGLRLMAYGFFQKMVLADNLAPIVNQAFNSASNHTSTAYWWMVMVAFSFQIYFDFAGYSSIARGLAQLMGYRFRQNFDHPYHAASLQDFWHRWHISLSTWFRDYVYIPLGGARASRGRMHRNIWITFLLSGLWHGAAYHYVLWAVAHSVGWSLERLTRWPQRMQQMTGGVWLNRLLVWVFLVQTWLLFRGESLEQIHHIWSCMWWPDGRQFEASAYLDAWVFIGWGIGVESWYALKRRYPRLRIWSRGAVYECVTFACLVMACVYLRGAASEFIYFQF